MPCYHLGVEVLSFFDFFPLSIPYIGTELHLLIENIVPNIFFSRFYYYYICPWTLCFLQAGHIPLTFLFSNFVIFFLCVCVPVTEIYLFLFYLN